KRFLLAISFIGGVLTLLAVVGRRKSARVFREQVASLFAIAEKIPNTAFNYDQLEGLPTPVQQYFRFALPERHPYINTLRLRHSGRFKTGIDKGWIPIEGEEYFTAYPPGFIWKGKTNLFTATDRYVDGKGQLVVKLLSLIEVARANGPEADQGELLRWLGEAVWFPTRLLPSEKLEWSALTNDTAQLSCTHQDLTVNFKVTFAKLGEITQIEAKRYYTPGRLEAWVGELYDYQDFEGVKVPTRIKATWKLPEGDYPYVDFKVNDIQFNASSPY
ncbi:MAG: DUF6544 family protein, partial [Bacteroidota bacterium]